MKTVVLLVASEVLLILAIVLLFSNWKGAMSFALGLPLTSCVVNINGGASGGWVVLAIVSLLLAAVTLVAGLVSAIKRPAQKAKV